jgi:predicted lipoprotein with Yx(FWY)xxD motif
LTTSALTVNAPSGVSGSFTIYKGANGSQVEYNGHPLYIFSGDTGPDQSHGEGLLGKWFVATPSLAPAASSPSPSPSSSSGGYSY